MNVWNVLGIETTTDESVIKKAYAKKLRLHHPQDDPEGFQQVKEAYEKAMKAVKERREGEDSSVCFHHDTRLEEDELDEEFDAGFEDASDSLDDETEYYSHEHIRKADEFILQAQALYNDSVIRSGLENWKTLLNSEVMYDLEIRDLLSYRLKEFIWDHYLIPQPVWRLFDDFFHWSETDDAFFALVHNHLYYAVNCNDLQLVRRVVDNGADLESRGSNGKTPLMQAAEYEYRDILSYLIEQGADIDATDEKGWTALLYAAFDGRMETVQYLAECGADLDATVNGIWSALIFAADKGYTEIASYLLDKGADASNLDVIYSSAAGLLERVRFFVESSKDALAVLGTRDITPLMKAVQNNKLEVAQYLLDQGADIEAKDMMSRTALMLAVIDNRIEAVELLLNNGADQNTRCIHKFSIFTRCVKEKHLELMKMLVARGVDVNERDGDKDTALITAARDGHLDIATGLIQAGADIQAVNYRGRSALIDASLRGHIPCIQLLMSHGADIHRQDSEGFTAFMLAAYFGRLEATVYLLSQGADPDVKGKDGETAIMLAAESGRKSVVDFLLEQGQDPDQLNLILSAGAGVTDRVKLLVEQEHVKINKQNHDMEKALVQAAYYGRSDIVEYLLKKGVATEFKISDGGRTALIVAVEHGELDCVKLLMKYHANPLTADKEGRTPLLNAVWKDQKNILEYFVRNGADLEQRDDKGNTALHLAAWLGNIAHAQYLLEQGANLEAKNKNNRTPLLSACEGYSIDMMRFLIERGAVIDLDVRNQNGETVEDFSKKYNRTEMIEYLKALKKQSGRRKKNK